MNVHRLTALLFVASPALLGPFACSSQPADTSSSAAAVVTAPPAWNQPSMRPASEAAALQQRLACQFSAGAMPAQTIGADIPVTTTVSAQGQADGTIPIQNIVVMMQENRSFDSYYAHLNQYRIAQGISTTNDIESAPENTTNPEDPTDPSSPTHPWQHAERLCFPSTNHEWFGAHDEWDNGKMDGFFETNQGYTDDCSSGPYPCANPKHVLDPSLLSGERALWWYDQTDIPFYYAVASAFGIADHYHSALLGPTWPNRDYLYAATSMGMTTNLRPDLSGKGFPGTDVVIFDELEKRHVTWKVYMDGGIPGLGVFFKDPLTRWGVGGLIEAHFRTTLDFYADAKGMDALGHATSLPQVSFVDPKLAFENTHFNNDEHPPGDIQNGQLLASNVVEALLASPQWPTTALFLTYDENGGIYDHVVPPAACSPDNDPPDLVYPNDQAVGPVEGYRRYGMRVPLIVVSPYVKKNYVSHNLYDPTSILRFIEAKFEMPALTGRDANADALFDFFDFSNPPYLNPPSIPAATVDADRLSECNTLLP